MSTRPVISSITMYDKDNYVNYSDTDSSTDYFNSYTIGTAHTIEWLKKDAGVVVRVSVVNEYTDSKYVKRLNRFAKAIGYRIKTVEKKGVYRISETDFQCHIRPYQYNEFYLYNPKQIKAKQIKV